MTDERKLLLLLARIQLNGRREGDHVDLVELVARMVADDKRAADEENELGRG